MAEVSGFIQCIAYNKLGNASEYERFVATGKSCMFVMLSTYASQTPC